MNLSFIKNIINAENQVVNNLKEIRSNGKPIYIYGAGSYAKMLYDDLVLMGFQISGFLVDDIYYTPGMHVDNLPVSRISDIVLQENIPANIVIGFTNSEDAKKKLTLSSATHYVWELDAFPAQCHNQITYSYVIDNLNEFERVYAWCSDEISRKALINYINCKITGLSSYLKEFHKGGGNSCGDHQYFVNDIINLSDSEVFVDCGSFDGDTISKFIEVVGGKYNRICCFEPSLDNYQRLIERINLENINDVDVFQIGTWDSKDELFFSESGSTSGISSADSMSKINVDSLDNVLSYVENISYIKMDVEGAELKSLVGAQNIIRKYHPKLAICVYHKKEDLLEIPRYIKELNPNYKLYFRQHSPISLEFVCYAIDSTNG